MNIILSSKGSEDVLKRHVDGLIPSPPEQTQV